MRDVRQLDRIRLLFGRQRFLSSAEGRGSTEAPSPDDIAELILRQKSAALALQTFRWALRLPSFTPTPPLYRAVIRSLLSFRRLDSAIEEWKCWKGAQRDGRDGAPKRGHLQYSDISLLQRGNDRALEAVEILERVETKGGIVDAVAYNALIKGFCDMAKPGVGRRVMREMERKGCLPNLQTYNTLILGFCNSEKIDSAMDLFREMEMDGITPGFVTYDTLIGGHCWSGRFEDGLKLLDFMEEQTLGKESKVAPYNSILYGFYKEGRMGEAREFLTTRMATSFPRVTERSLRILEFCSDSRISEAMLVYDEMVKEGDFPSVLVYDCLVQGLSEQGEVREAFDMMNVMVDKRFFPLPSTFNALIRGFCRAGRFGNASKLIEEMESRKCMPDADSYSPLVCGLCENGEFDKACGFVVQMVERGLIPPRCIWNCLLVSENLCKQTESTVQISEALSGCFTDE